MFSESNNNFRDFFLLIAGCIGLIWFFFSYKSLDPVSSVSHSVSKERVYAKTDSVITSWQIYSKNTLHKMEMKSYKGLVDSLQHKYQNVGLSTIMEREGAKGFPLYFWEIDNYEKEEFYTNGEEISEVKATPGGEIISFFMSGESVKKLQPYNVNVFTKSLGLEFEKTEENLALQDSLLAELLSFQSATRGDFTSFQKIQKYVKLLGARNPEGRDLFIRDTIWENVSGYLSSTYWGDLPFKNDSLEFEQSEGVRFVRAFLTAKDTVFGQLPKLQVDILHAGGLKAITLEMVDVDTPPRPYADVIRILIQFTFLCFGIWLISAFYLRIKARAIDTQPAFVISVLAGFMFSAIQFLRFAKDIELDFETIQNIPLSERFFVIGILGGICAVLFFILTTVSDSVTRQHWPEKMKAWDLARRGFFKNKPVGRSIIFGVCIAGVLAGVWVVLMQLLPGAHIEGDIEFQASNFAFPSVAMLLENLLASILVVISILMIIGNQLYSLTKWKWVIPLLSGFIFALFLDFFVSINIHPMNVSMALNFVIGALLGVFYIHYGFLTMVLSLFTYAGLFTTRYGWVLENSPDLGSFYFFSVIVLSMVTVGIYFIINGSEKKDLPDYLPDYIEDQAREQRVDQELEIAQDIQKAFLPSRAVQLPGIDIAGICEPAQETGGDYYDMISLGKNRMAIAIGDVSGKGIQAAFYMTFVKGVLHSLSALILSPLEILNQLNRLFKENATRGTFISMIYGILEADKRLFTFARAGHNPMLVVRANGDTEWLQSKGIGLGVTNSLLFLKGTEEVQLKLEEGDVAVLYTDGITEMLNISNQFYGEERLEKLVKGIRKGASSKILDIIISEVTEFKGVAKQHDDMTLVIIKADASVNK